MACIEVAEGVLVCRASGTYERVPLRRRRRFWCFTCRKHLMHELWVFRNEHPSWYADWVEWKCPSCGENNTRFPGY